MPLNLTNYEVNVPYTCATLAPKLDGVDPQPISDAWMIDTLGSALREVYATGGMRRVLIFIDGHLSTMVILSRKDADRVLISTSEFVNLETHVEPLSSFATEQLLALPYELYARATRMRGTLEQFAPFEVDQLWGWGCFRCDVHLALCKNDYVIEKAEFPFAPSDSEAHGFIDAIKQWALRDQRRLTYAVM